MAISRSEAIDLAVRRHMTNCPLAWWQREALEYGFFQPSPLAQKAIRAHFRSIVRTYGVREESRADALKRIVAVTNRMWDELDAARDARYPEYDGHSMRH